MITIKQILNAYETIQKAKIEQELLTENRKLQQAINEHYTCYNRCYYLKYEPNEKNIIKNSLKLVLEKFTIDKKSEKELKKIITKLEKNSIYWKLENK